MKHSRASDRAKRRGECGRRCSPLIIDAHEGGMQQRADALAVCRRRSEARANDSARAEKPRQCELQQPPRDRGRLRTPLSGKRRHGTARRGVESAARSANTRPFPARAAAMFGEWGTERDWSTANGSAAALVSRTTPILTGTTGIAANERGRLRVPSFSLRQGEAPPRARRKADRHRSSRGLRW